MRSRSFPLRVVVALVRLGLAAICWMKKTGSLPNSKKDFFPYFLQNSLASRLNTGPSQIEALILSLESENLVKFIIFI